MIAIALERGEMIEEYRIEDILGKGGFAITYLATDTRLDKQVAIKELLPDGIATRVKGNTVVALTASQESDFRWAVDSFLQEAKVLASFEHPNIVSVLRLFETNGTAYIVMPLIQGKTIKEIISQQGKLPYETVHSIIHPLLNGLTDVHAKGVLHRDIKPENIFLTDQGMPVLIDFGAARQQVSGKSQNITSIITPGYAPIEQYSTDARYQGAWSDIYAMATVAYHMITGKRPTAASERNDALRNQSPDPLVSLSSLAPAGYPPHFLAALDRALLMSENQRPVDVATWLPMLGEPPQLSGANSSLTPSQSYRPVALPSGPTKSSKKIIILGSLIGLILLLIGGGVFLAINSKPSEPEPRQSAADTPNRPPEDTPVAMDTSEVIRQADSFLANYADGFWSGQDAWYLSDTRITDEFAIALHRNLAANNKLDPILNREIKRQPSQLASARRVMEKNGSAVVDLDSSGASPLQLVMVRQGRKWLVDGRTGGNYQLNTRSDISPRMDEKELLLTARKRKRNLISMNYTTEGELRGILTREAVRTIGGTSRQQPFIKFSNRFLKIDLTHEQEKELGITVDRYYSKIPLFYQNSIQNGFREIEGMIGKQVILTGRLASGNHLPDTHPLGLYVHDINKQLGIKPRVLAGQWSFPDSHRRLLKDHELSPLNAAQLWRARNEIFARRGLIFNSAKGKAFIRSLGSDYTPISKDQTLIWKSMNAIEQANVDAIKRYEASSTSTSTPPVVRPPVATLKNSLKARLHPAISTQPSSVYLGKLGESNAIYSIQWLPNNMLRGSIFLYNEGKERYIYGTNFQDGVIELEIWEGADFIAKARMSKQANSSTVRWTGSTLGSARTPMHYARALVRASSDTFSSHYYGKVGSSVIDVTLNWLANGTVRGSYRSRSTGNTYQLAGDNTVSGFLYLDEFTSGNLSARVLLIKKNINGTVHWSGSLFNTDGRVKQLSFTKK